MKWIVLLFYALVRTFNTQAMANEYGRRSLEIYNDGNSFSRVSRHSQAVNITAWYKR
jgi:hypothetical protein